LTLQAHGLELGLEKLDSGPSDIGVRIRDSIRTMGLTAKD